MDVTTLYDLLEPHIVRTITSGRVTLSNAGAGTGSGMEQHALFGTYHTGQLDESQALWVSPLITNRIADHAAQADVHHAQLHSILDPSHHSVSGGLAFDVFGQSGPGVIARLTPKHSPGVAAELLRSDADGSITLPLMRTSRLIGNVDDLTLEAVDDIILSPTSKVYSTVKVGILNADAAYELDVTGTGRFTADLIVGANATVSTKVTTPRIEAAADLTIAPTGDIFLGPIGGQIRVLSAADLQTDNFQSQLNGWRLTYSGELDTRYIYSDQMKVKIFIADVTRALAGSEIISKSATDTSRTFRVPFPGDSTLLYLNDLPSAENMAVFEPGDFTNIREFDRGGGSLNITNCWGTVSSYVDLANKEQQWTFTRSGTNSGANIAQVGTRRVANTSTSSATVVKVTGTANGHFMATFIVLDRNTTITAPAGWTVMYSQPIETGRVALYFKFAGASEPANYTWTFGSTGQNMVSLYCYSNVNPSFPSWGELNVSVQSGFPAGVMQGQSVWSASSQGDMVLLFGGIIGNHTGGAPAPGMTERYDQVWNGVIGTYMAEWKQLGSGDVGEMPISLTTDAFSVCITLNLLPPFTLDLATGFAVPGTLIVAESVVLDYGVSGNGWIESTTVDGLYGSNSPYTRIVTWTTHPATGAVVRNQMGHLRGLFGVANEFGFYAGNGTTNNDAHLRLSNITSTFNNIPITMTQVGVTRIKLDATTGLNLKLASAADTLTAIRWQDNLGVSTDGAKIDVFSGGSATQMLINLEAIDAAPIALMELRTVNNVGLQQASISLNSGASFSEIFAISNKIYIGSFVSGNTNLIELRVVSGGHIWANGAMNIGSATTIVTNDGTLSLGNTTVDYTPISSTWNTTGSTLLLNALNYSTIAFHDSGSRVDYIRVGAGTITLGYDGGYGAAVIGIRTTPSRSLTVGGTIKISTTDAPFTTSSWGKAIELNEAQCIQWLKSTSSTSRGIGYTSDGNLYFFTSTVNDGTGAPTYDLILGADGTLSISGPLTGAWTALSFSSGWANYDAGWIQCSYKKVGDLVFLRGLAKRTSGSGTVIGTLPSGYRPSNSHMITAWSDTGVARTDISAAGDITLISGGVGWVSLFSTVFSTL